MFEEISGLLFLFIIVTLNVASQKYDYDVFSELDAEAKLQWINENPSRFRTGVSLLMAEHAAIVLLAITLFIAFSSYNILLGTVWLLSRSVEGLIQTRNKRNYLGLVSVAEEYATTTGSERGRLEDLTRSILESKNSTFAVAQILFSIGTLAYSLLFLVYGVMPQIIGWFGVAASITYLLGSGYYLVRPGSKALWGLGGLLIFIFELVLGGWLLLSPILVP